MKTTLLLILFISFIHQTDDNNKHVITSKQRCYTLETNNGKCTGSAYCTTCKNCSRCAHCSNGGSCGVCDSGVKKSYSSTNKKNTSITKKNYLVGNNLYVTNTSLNLRSGPGINYEIVEKLSKNDELTFVKKQEDWIKVIVTNSKNTGWVFYKYVK